MSAGRRFLFVVPPEIGHVNHVFAVAAQLETRGNTVAWLAPRAEMEPLLPPGAEIFDLRFGGDRWRALSRLDLSAAPPRVLEVGLGALPAAEAAVDAFRPDALVVDRMLQPSDQLMLAGTLAARRRDLPWATLSTGGGAPVRAVTGVEEISSEAGAAVDAIQRAVGLTPLAWPLASPHLVLVFSTHVLVAHRGFPPHYRLVGAAVGHRTESTPFPWETLGEPPRVLVSLGTVYRGRGIAFYPAVAEALAQLDVQAVVSAPRELVPEPPSNVIVRDYLPQLALLPHVDAVVCHGGHNTVSEALLHALPLVIAPIIDDQPVIAQQVAGAGAAILVRFAEIDAGEVRRALEAVLFEPRYREAAARIKASFEAAGGTSAAADALERLAA